MAQQKVWLGKVGPFIYDDVSGDLYIEDGVAVTGLRLTGQGRVETDPTEDLHIVNLRYMRNNTLSYKRNFQQVANIEDPSPELALLNGAVVGGVIFCYQVVGGVNLWAGYLWDSSSTNPALTPYRIQGNGGFWLGFFRNVEGEIHQEGNHVPSADALYGIGTGVRRWLEGHFASVYADNVPSLGNELCNKNYVDAVIGGGGSNVQFASVASFANPAAELATISSANGRILIVYQAGASANDTVTAYYADASAGAVNVPYVVQGNGVRWIALAGRYANSALTIVGAITALGAITTPTLTVSGSGTIANLTIATLLAVNGNISASGVMTLSGQPCCKVEYNGSIALADSVDTAITFTSEAFDQANNFSANTFTAPVIGMYSISITAVGTCAAGNPEGQLINLKIFKGGVENDNFPFASAANWGGGGTTIVSLGVGDAITFKARQNTGAAGALTYCRVSIMKVC